MFGEITMDFLEIRPSFEEKDLSMRATLHTSINTVVFYIGMHLVHIVIQYIHAFE